MFNTKTLFVIGAGASYEVGLPLGDTLLETIAGDLDYRIEHFNRPTSGNRVLFNAWMQHYGDNNVGMNAVIDAARKIHHAHGFANSIDQFIDTHYTDELVAFCGKCAITLFILEEERKSDIYVDSDDRNARLKLKKEFEPWFVPFSKMLFEGVRVDRIDTLFDNLSIVCFNYDRCIEHFLAYSISQHYQVNIGDARQLVYEKLKIIHPYGQVGDLPIPNNRHGVNFGEAIGGERLIEVSSMINTFTEQRDEGKMDAVKAEVSNAETVVFLGFGFLPDNMEILIPNNGSKVDRIFATVFKESAPNQENIRKAMRPFLSPSLNYSLQPLN